MYKNNEGNGEQTSEGNSNIFLCTGHSNQTNINLDNLASIHTNQTNQTPNRGNQGHELREFNCNYRQCENQIISTNRCGSLCQDGTCRDPNCRSYWNITLTPCSNREPVRRLSKENKVSPSDARRKSLDSQRTSPSTNLPKEKPYSPSGSASYISRTSDQERRNSATGVQKASIPNYSPRTPQNEEKISAVDFARTSDQKMNYSAGSYPNVSRTSDLEETNLASGSTPYISRTSAQERWNSASTGVQNVGTYANTPRTSQNEKKISAVDFTRTSDQKMNYLTGSYPNVSRTSDLEETNSAFGSTPYISRTSDQERRYSATGIQKASISTYSPRTSQDEKKTSEQRKMVSAGSSPNVSRTSYQEETNSPSRSDPYIFRTSDQERTGFQKASISTNLPRASQNEKKISAVITSDQRIKYLTGSYPNVLRTIDLEETASGSVPYISRTSDQERRYSAYSSRTSQNEEKISAVNFTGTSDQKKMKSAGSSPNVSLTTYQEDTNSPSGSSPYISRTSDQERRYLSTGDKIDSLPTNEKKTSAVNFTRTSDQKKYLTGSYPNILRTSDLEETDSTPSVQKAGICTNFPRAFENEKDISAASVTRISDQKKTNLTGSSLNIPRISDLEETNLTTGVRKDKPGKVLSLKESLMEVQQRRQEDNQTSCALKKIEGRKRTSPINLLRSINSVNPSPSAISMVPAKSADKLATIKEENHPVNSSDVVQEIECNEGFPRVATIINYFNNNGVQVEEIDIGQPCLGCETCKGYEAHSWRKNCRNCKCPRDNHAISEFAARSRIGFSASNESLEPRTTGYTFVPSGLTKANQVAQYYSLFPSHEVPKMGSEGEVYRSQRLVKQLPKQDLSLAVCKFVETNQKGSFQDFIQARNEIALDIGYVKTASSAATCEYCEKTIPNGQYSIAAMKMGDLLWHPTCFRCSKCDDLLVDLAYCVYKDKIYCERHYAECLKPRCEGCDELIFSGEYTKAMNKDWHGQHFCCWQCDESLTGQRYVLRDDHPYCVSCYESVFANACEKCSRTIGIDSKDLSYKDKHWHEACFLCTTCGESLVDKQFGSKGERIYCGRCYDNQFASRCDGCNEIFRAGTKKMEYKTRQWHEKCFCCCVCKVPIGTQSFIPREQEIYCAKCYEEKFATRCIKCNKVITSGGVTYKNEPWHRECFTCTHCSKSLAGERFTSREEKPYCAECFGELFAKRCFACNKPITGIGGTKFISFEDRHWHNDCFFCAMCRSSLVGRGFITDQDDIICPECAKQKLL